MLDKALTRKPPAKKPARKAAKKKTSHPPKNKGGRKVYWTEARKTVAMDIICEELSTTEQGLKSILGNNPECPSMAEFFRWQEEDEELRERYVRAREAQAELNADNITKIADDEDDPHKARVRIDARKWAASKRAPKRYGDRLQIDGDMTIKLTDEQVESRLAKLIGKAGASGAAGGKGTAEGET